VRVAVGVSLPRAGVVLTGDALVTGRPPRPAAAPSSPARLDADVVLPGHGTGDRSHGVPGSR
jgi:glyoxylase-like metal-dependent hydrolase (beta-lactamase superfamily II)